MILLIIYLSNRNIAFDECFGYFLDKHLSYQFKIKSVAVKRNIKFKLLTDEDFYVHFAHKRITMILMSLTVFFYIYLFLGIESLVYNIFLSIFIVFFPDIRLKEDKKAIEEKIMSELPDAFMSLKLLVGAGMTIEKSLENISQYNGLFYTLVEEVVKNIHLGQSLNQNMMTLAGRCQIQSVTQFCRIMIMDEKNGSYKTQDLLERLCQDLWKQKRALYLKKGEEASTKLLIPMMISLVGVIIAVTIPAIVQLFTAF